MSYTTRQRRRSAAAPRARKIARLWCLAHDLGMDEAMLRVVVASVSGSESISKLTWPQLIQSVRALEQEKRRQLRHESYERSKQARAGVVFLPTSEQKKLVQTLLDEIDKLNELRNAAAYLDAVCLKIVKKNYHRLTRQETGTVIEALKSIVNRSRIKEVTF